MTDIVVFGGGYIGTVSAACLADLGHHVTVVDKDVAKVRLFEEGLAPIVEPGIDELVAKGCRAGRIRAVVDPDEGLDRSAVSLVCVGTPPTAAGKPELGHVMRVVETIAHRLCHMDTYHVIAIRSTVVPGTVRWAIQLTEKISGKRHGVDFSICANPEFLREGEAISDFMKPPYTLVGALDERGARTLRELYAPLQSETIVAAPEEAEIIKYVNNSFHALKVTFANEMGTICKQLSIDSHVVMDIFCRDRLLNISSNYLRPGYAFGGSCLPKDIRALCYLAKSHDVETPLLTAVMPSNERQIGAALRMVQDTGKTNIGIVGLAFKTGTDDLRESPMVRLAEQLIGKGYKVLIYDRHVSAARIHGANREFALQHISHIEERLVPEGQLHELMAFAEVLVVGGRFPELDEAVLNAAREKPVIDLVRIQRHRQSSGQYHGICW